MNDKYWHSVLQNKLPRRRLLALMASAGASAAFLACSGGDDDDEAAATTGSSTSSNASSVSNSTGATQEDDVERPSGWAEASHSNAAEPDYDTVFPKDRVNQMTFTVSAENWQAMLDDMTQLSGERGASQASMQGAGQGAGGVPPAGQDGNFPGGDGNFPGGQNGGPGGGGGFGGDLVSENPMWVPVTVAFNGLEWTNVGLRFKGNSSLRSAWSSGTDKMPLKLDFDEFEDDFPAIKNQRFYGFKQLSLSNNFGDASSMRESLAYDLLEEAGLVAAETGFYEIVLDYGEGPASLGLYTVVEVIDDTVIGKYFDDTSGNIYEAEGSGASFAEGTDVQIPASFQVESDEEQADWSDIQALYDVLHSEQRFEDAQAWRASLESIFDVQPFLEWLALSALLQHWDTYGGMSHNFYLYNDPATGLINWISWDHNLVLGASAGGGGGQRAGAGAPAGIGGRAGVSFDKSGGGENWPLISYLMTQPEYAEAYNGYIRELLETVFEPSKVIAKIEANESILAPVAERENATYAADVDALISTVEQRVTAAEEYLASL